MTINKEVHTLEGVVLRKFPTEFGVGQNGKKWAKNKFVLKTNEGRDLYVSKFGNFDTQLLGQNVRFQATKFNETNYTVQGEVGTAQAQTTPSPIPSPSETTVESPAPAKRGRPAKAKVEPEAEVVNPVVSDAPVASNDAVAIVKENLLAAIQLAKEVNLTNINLVDLGDMIGRTRVALRIEANKDRRMDSFSRK